jgi:CheY-like chemotaxis protein
MVTSSLSTIFLIDADPQFVYLMNRYVENCGFVLILAERSANIIDLVEKTKPAIIFMNVRQPESDYSDLLRTLKSKTSTAKIPVVLCSASETTMRDWMLESDECLIQPIMYTDFIRVISEAGLDVHVQKGCL